jgi:hypothetical protein
MKSIESTKLFFDESETIQQQWIRSAPSTEWGITEVNTRCYIVKEYGFTELALWKAKLLY